MFIAGADNGTDGEEDGSAVSQGSKYGLFEP